VFIQGRRRIKNKFTDAASATRNFDVELGTLVENGEVRSGEFKKWLEITVHSSRVCFHLLLEMMRE
jgi:hypothetical protein